MLPRPLLTSTFALTYRKIPVLLIGRSLYCDTSLIIEALEHHFPSSSSTKFGTVYPPLLSGGLDDWSYKSLVRGFASFWTDKPLFRATTGLIPPSVWETRFGEDRSQLIGHVLDSQKLGEKRGENLERLDLHLSMLEPTFTINGEWNGKWAIPTTKPSLADISLYYQIRWGVDIAAGRGIENLTGGGTGDTEEDVTGRVWNQERYPGLWAWFQAFEKYVDALDDLQDTDPQDWLDAIKKCSVPEGQGLLVPTAVEYQTEIQRGLVPGKSVSVAPDDTGRDNPQLGTLVAVGVEEVVLKPEGEAEVDVLVHFPRLGFVVRGVKEGRL